MKTLIAAAAVGLGLIAAAVSQTPGKQTTAAPPCESGLETVATIGGAPVTAAELHERIGDRLLAARTSEYELRQEMLHNLIADRLLEREAARRNVSVSTLLAAEVDAKVPPVSDQEKRMHYEAVKDRVGDRPVDQVLADIGNGLRERRLAMRRQELVGELSQGAGVELLLEPPRARAQVGDDPFWGPASAAVTIVEFSDFQCPYCGRVAPTLKRIRETYGDQVRLVYRDFPLSFHPDAAKAAEAAACAGDQGKFWEMHDKIFEKAPRMSVADLKAHAAELGLAAGAFAGCLDSGRKASAMKTDLEAAEAVGVTGTPAFLINGRLLTGAQPFENFAAIIDDELARARRAASASKP